MPFFCGLGRWTSLYGTVAPVVFRAPVVLSPGIIGIMPGKNQGAKVLEARSSELAPPNPPAPTTAAHWIGKDWSNLATPLEKVEKASPITGKRVTGRASLLFISAPTPLLIMRTHPPVRVPEDPSTSKLLTGMAAVVGHKILVTPLTGSIVQTLTSWGRKI